MSRIGIFGTSGMAREAGDIAWELGLEPVYVARNQSELDACAFPGQFILENDIDRYQNMGYVIGIGDNGEETGLRGASAFAEQNKLMKSVALVVNVESRGDTGPSVMFETGPGNSRLIDLFSQATRAPVSSSSKLRLDNLP